MKGALYLFIFVIAGLSLSAQPLNGDFRFENGFYSTHKQLISNQPSVKPDSTRFEILASGQTGNLFAALMTAQDSTTFFDGIQYIVENGRVYINASENLNGLNRFVLLSVLGRIAMFEKDFEYREMIDVKAYNPLNGQPFREGQVEKKTRKTIPFLLIFETGEILPFNYDYFLASITGDELLVNQVKQIDQEDRAMKLYKCLLIYNDRNSFLIEQNKE